MTKFGHFPPPERMGARHREWFKLAGQGDDEDDGREDKMGAGAHFSENATPYTRKGVHG